MPLQVQRDRRLENRIAAVGVGVGVASTKSSAFSALVKGLTRFYPIKVDSKKLPWGEPLSNLTHTIVWYLRESNRFLEAALAALD
ncbi:hypothetical protein F7734_40695 [Scytonema sp. UIC 10036]|uniref:hypothetical protein n=1 Tax=Scytonema sp. UIC 10036 TaxID=2304196 RepID=UPI0012DA21CD|nr:hypothetical protein [Scytonema sp. UIC 10036]MUG98291.1 hypothetical protein [Scytonema sp. UIC 10036]